MKNQMGFGLIEMLIAVVLFGIIAAGLANLTGFQAASQKNFRATSELDNSMLELKQAFSSGDVCKANLMGLVFDRTLLDPGTGYQMLRFLK